MSASGGALPLILITGATGFIGSRLVQRSMGGWTAGPPLRAPVAVGRRDAAPER